MGYWTHEYLLKTWGGPMVQAEFLRDVMKPFFIPRVFSGFNLFLDKPQLLPDAVDLIARECRTKRAFIVTDEYAVRFAEKVMSPYKKRHGISFEIWAKALSDAPIETVKDCTEQIKKFEPDLIFALGGGSAMDTAKAAWLLYEHPSVELEILSPLIPLNLRNKAKLVCIPTTSGTGSEVSGVAVVSFPDGVKLPVSVVVERYSATCPRVLSFPMISGETDGRSGICSSRVESISTLLMESIPRSDSMSMSRLSISIGYPVSWLTTSSIFFSISYRL